MRAKSSEQLCVGRDVSEIRSTPYTDSGALARNSCGKEHPSTLMLNIGGHCMNAGQDYTVDVVVIGLGYVGLPLAQLAASRGLRVAGLDKSSETVALLNSGKSHVDDISDAAVQQMIEQGFKATCDDEILSLARNVIICVPTPLSQDGSPDLSAVKSASLAVANNVRPGTLVSLESTTSPGTTEEILLPMLEARGLVIGETVFLVFSPERIDPGNAKYTLQNTPKIVGGVTETCRDRGVGLYESLVDIVVPVSGVKEAELSKLLENTYRQLNIALVNELARYCHELKIDIWEVIRGAATKPFGFQPFYPGPGIGGHCIPIDPSYLSYTVNAKLGYPFRLVELAQEVNNSMPQYVVSRAQEKLNEKMLSVNGSTVVLVGITYKANISDKRESPALEIAKRLSSLGAQVSFNDPYYDDWDPLHEGTSLPFVAVDKMAKETADLVILLQHHDAVDIAAIEMSGCTILDTRGKLAASANVSLL